MNIKPAIVFTYIAFIFGQNVNAQKIDESWLEAINSGKKFYSQAKYNDAIESFRKASQIVPTDTTAYIYLIDCGSKLSKPLIVYNSIEKLEFTDYRSAWMYIKGIATARDIQKDLDKANKYLAQAMQLYPANKDLKAEEIKNLFLDANYKVTKQKINEFLSAYPKSYAQLAILLHITFSIDKDYPEALRILKTSIEEFPDSIYLRELEANVYLIQKDAVTAKSKFEEILVRDPKDAKAYYNLARIYYDMEDGKKAVELSEKAIGLDSLFSDAIYNLGTYYYYWGLSYNQALSEMSPEQYVFQGKEVEDSAILLLRKAKPYFEKVIRLRPDELDAYENLSTLNVMLGNLSSNKLISFELTQKPSPEKNIQAQRMPEKMAERDENDTKKSMDVVKEDDYASSELEMHNLEMQYPTTDSSGLHKGETGHIRFVIANQGNMKSGGLEAVIMEPLAIPDLEYNASLRLKSLMPGDSVQVEIPVKYLMNNAQTAGMDKLANIGSKLRIFIKDSTGFSSGLQEVAIKLSHGLANQANYSATEDIVFNPYTGGRNFLLIIAIDDYQSWPKLKNAVNDASSVKDVLTKKYRFVPDFMYELYNSDASKEKLRNVLIKIKQDITENDNLVIYYAGHGDYNTDFNEGAWIPYDAKLNSSADYLSNSTLLSYLKSLQSRHIFLIADACFSGSLFVSDAEVTYQENNDKLKSRWALSSGNLEYVADGAGAEHSPFAKFLVQALNDNKRDKISVSELVSYVKFMVKNASQQSPVGKPLRVTGNEGGDYIFYSK
jgi:tetratricopeptide (TPR) repeat protein